MNQHIESNRNTIILDSIMKLSVSRRREQCMNEKYDCIHIKYETRLDALYYIVMTLGTNSINTILVRSDNSEHFFLVIDT